MKDKFGEDGQSYKVTSVDAKIIEDDNLKM